jgi:hypothetical protein
MKALAEMNIIRRREQLIAEYPGNMQVARASVLTALGGDADGVLLQDQVLHYTLNTVHHKEATFAAVMVFEGTITEKTGTFVLVGTGCYAGEHAQCNVSVKPGTGTDDFAGITGGGQYYFNHQLHKHVLELDYTLDANVNTDTLTA